MPSRRSPSTRCPGTSASGTAEVVVRTDGSRALEVQLDAPALADGYSGVWLIEPSITDMVPFGIAAGTRTSSFPRTWTSADPLVDVSKEPLDSDPPHSGVSVVRGQLELERPRAPQPSTPRRAPTGAP